MYLGFVRRPQLQSGIFAFKPYKIATAPVLILRHDCLSSDITAVIFGQCLTKRRGSRLAQQLIGIADCLDFVALYYCIYQQKSSLQAPE